MQFKIIKTTKPSKEPLYTLEISRTFQPKEYLALLSFYKASTLFKFNRVFIEAKDKSFTARAGSAYEYQATTGERTYFILDNKGKLKRYSLDEMTRVFVN
ncbi:hypothetical protein AWB71_05271 [Caballeronia peredens]|nr:hypothetical protein AWB71_05271 [Caballeronia peredens]